MEPDLSMEMVAVFILLLFSAVMSPLQNTLVRQLTHVAEVAEESSDSTDNEVTYNNEE